MAVVYRSASPEAAAPQRAPIGGWGRTLIRAAPIVAVVLAVLTVGVIVVYVHDSNRRGAVSLSNDLLDAVEGRIAAQMDTFLAPPEQFLDSARALSGDQGVFDGARATEEFALKKLPKIAQISGYSYADPEGNFMYVVRNAAGGFDTKLMDRRGGGRRVTWTRRSAEGRVLETTSDPQDDFDPRTRSWYRGAERRKGGFWTEAYLFFTLQAPGITYSLPHYDPSGRLVAVSGVDVELATFSTFLKHLSIGVTGRAVVVDKSGRVIAFPRDDWKGLSGEMLPRLDEMNDPVLTRLYSRLTVEGFTRKILDVGDERIIVSTGPLKALTGRDWTVLIVVPEGDFVGFVSTSGWVALALSILVFVIMAALAAQVMWRGIQAERSRRAAASRQRALEDRAQTFAELAAASELFDADAAEGARSATERAAASCRARRVGIWRLSADGRTFICEDCYDSSGHAHTSSAQLHRDELPSLFAEISAGKSIDASDIRSDSRTRELAENYLGPLGSRGVHISPIRSGSQLLGMLMVEDPGRGNTSAGLEEFCGALAGLLALRFAPSRGLAPRVDTTSLLETRQHKINKVLKTREVALQRALLRYSTSLSEIGAGHVENGAVAVIMLPEWLSVVQRGTDGRRARMDAVLDEIRRAVDRSAVSYAALQDDQVVLAAYGGDVETIATNARAVAQAAVDIRDRLADVVADWEGGDFRIALDVGSIMASPGGTEAEPDLLWGGAIAVAKLLAASGGRRAINVSEATYRALAGEFLFRQRGSFFLPETGAMRTFVLVGEL